VRERRRRVDLRLRGLVQADQRVDVAGGRRRQPGLDLGRADLGGRHDQPGPAAGRAAEADEVGGAVLGDEHAGPGRAAKVERPAQGAVRLGPRARDVHEVGGGARVPQARPVAADELALELLDVGDRRRDQRQPLDLAGPAAAGDRRDRRLRDRGVGARHAVEGRGDAGAVGPGRSEQHHAPLAAGGVATGVAVQPRVGADRLRRGEAAEPQFVAHAAIMRQDAAMQNAITGC